MSKHAGYKDYILSNRPRKITVGYLHELLDRKDFDAKCELIDFIFHRLHSRYLEPLFHVPVEHKSGFLMMASACLLIETMQAFYSGRKETPRGEGRRTFEDFFKREQSLFPGFKADAENFYRKIRCGILHQAETCGGYRILRSGPLLDLDSKTINANAFIKALEKSLTRYVESLRNDELNSPLWKNAQKKIRFISENCQ